METANKLCFSDLPTDVILEILSHVDADGLIAIRRAGGEIWRVLRAVLREVIRARKIVLPPDRLLGLCSESFDGEDQMFDLLKLIKYRPFNDSNVNWSSDVEVVGLWMGAGCTRFETTNQFATCLAKEHSSRILESRIRLSECGIPKSLTERCSLDFVINLSVLQDMQQFHPTECVQIRIKHGASETQLLPSGEPVNVDKENRVFHYEKSIRLTTSELSVKILSCHSAPKTLKIRIAFPF